MMAEATMTKAVYNVNLGVNATIYATKPIHMMPRITKRNITDVFIASVSVCAKIRISRELTKYLSYTNRATASKFGVK